MVTTHQAKSTKGKSANANVKPKGKSNMKPTKPGKAPKYSEDDEDKALDKDKDLDDFEPVEDGDSDEGDEGEESETN